MLVNRAPHPNAARVYINWFLSREGQITSQSAEVQNPGESSTNSLREDIPKDILIPDRRRVKDVYYLPLDRWDMLDMEPIYKVINEGLAQGGKR
jgi:ABC-type Fe3+ transport system substrate-binding protein